MGVEKPDDTTAPQLNPLGYMVLKQARSKKATFSMGGLLSEVLALWSPLNWRESADPATAMRSDMGRQGFQDHDVCFPLCRIRARGCGNRHPSTPTNPAVGSSRGSKRMIRGLVPFTILFVGAAAQAGVLVDFP